MSWEARKTPIDSEKTPEESLTKIKAVRLKLVDFQKKKEKKKVSL